MRFPLHSSLALALALFTASPAASDAAPYAPEFLQGNYFYNGSSNSTTLTPTAGAYVRFTATETTNATSISVNINAAGLNATSVTLALVAADGDGNLGETILAQGSTAPVVGWNTITFEGAQLNAGQVYYMVAKPETSGTARLRHLTGTPTLDFQGYGIRDTAYTRGVLDAAGKPSGAPSNSVALVYAIGTESRGIGYAYEGGASSRLSASIPVAQRFQFTPSDSSNTILDTLTLRLVTDGANLKDVQVTLLNDANTVLGTATLAGTALISGTTQNYTISFEDDLVLTEGDYYRLAVHSGEAGASSVLWSYNRTTSVGTTNDAINSATFQGADGYAFGYSDLTFSTAQNAAYGNDYIFSYTVIPEPSVSVAFLIGIGVFGVLRRQSKVRAESLQPASRS